MTTVPLWQITDGSTNADLGTYPAASVEEAFDLQARAEGFVDDAERQAEAPRVVEGMKVGSTELWTTLVAAQFDGKPVETFDPAAWPSHAASDFSAQSCTCAVCASVRAGDFSAREH